MPVQFAFLDFQAGYSEATFHYTDNIPARAAKLEMSTYVGIQTHIELGLIDLALGTTEHT